MTIYYWKEARVNGVTIDEYYRPIELLSRRGSTCRFAKFGGGSFTVSQRQVDIWIANGQMQVRP